MLAELTHESFGPLLGSGFAIAVGEHEDVLTLTEVVPRPELTGYARTPFTLVFNGGRNDALFHSQLLELRHPELGTLPLLISPVGRNADGTFRYEAVFG
ncbi:MAG: hypothetical protein WDN31_02315 [Hyphomicrobium sp.]